MTESIIGIIFGFGVTVYSMTRSWQCYRRAGETPESRVVSLVMSIIFGLIGSYMSLCVWNELKELL